MHGMGWCLALLAAAPVCAEEAPPDWQAVADTVLEATRGGFDNGAGLMVSIGVERLVTVNGSTVSSSSFSVGMPIGALAGQGAELQGTLPASYTLVQNGAGNVALPGAMPQAIGGLVLQNSANDQLLRSQTTISASVNSLAALRSINLEGSLRQALAYVVGAH